MNQHLERGKLLLQQHRHREAEAEFKMHLSLEPNDDEAHLYLALCYLHGNKLDDATISIQQSIALFPHNAFAFYIYSRILFGQEKYKESRQKIDEAINIQPMDANFFAWSAQLHLFNKDYSGGHRAPENRLPVRAGAVVPPGNQPGRKTRF